MAFTIIEQMAKPGDDLYYDPAFRLIVETHLNILKHSRVVQEDIPLDLFYQYEGDFYGYLVERGIPTFMHWIYLRVNGMTNPNEFAKEQRDPLNRAYSPVLLRPHDNTVSGLRSFYLSRKF